jgi:hypothetical protein
MLSDPDMAKYSVYDLHALQLSCVFLKLYKLYKLMLTIPATSAANECSFSALKRLKNCLRNSQSQDMFQFNYLHKSGAQQFLISQQLNEQ